MENQDNTKTKAYHILSKKWYILITVLLGLMIAASVVWFVPALRYGLRDKLNQMFPSRFAYTVYYEDCVPYYSKEEVDFENHDVREVQVGNGRKYLVNHSRGFALGFPRDAEFDFTAAQEYISVKCENMDAVVSKEYTAFTEGERTREYINDSLHKYILDENFREQNRITLHKNAVEKIGDYWMQTVAISRQPAPDSPVEYNTYMYCYIYTYSPMFYRIMFKTSDYTEEFIDEVYRTLYSFSEDVKIVGTSGTFTDFKPVIPKNWNEETKAFYDSLVHADSCKWGIYTPWAVFNDDFKKVHELENKIDEKFEGVLEYKYHFDDMPIAGMQTAYEEGKIVELTLQTATVMNEYLNGYTPAFDIIDGRYDNRFRQIAAQIRDFGHPVLFRLNNEMNSDWTSYGSSVCLTDPELFVQIWRRMYDIFEEEGVNNAIWVFNPNDESYPPNGYNSSIAFYPGNEYVQVFGITGYNTGTYYDELNGEKWKTFDEIYSEIDKKYGEIYGEFPWIITEFASSSVGGDKEDWITDMFAKLKNYPKIKMAFWFNSADYDPRPEANQAVARPYWFDETPETTKAFSDGLKKLRGKPILETAPQVQESEQTQTTE